MERGPSPPVSLAKGRPLNGQSRGQLRLTRTSYAECPPDKQGEAREYEERCLPPAPLGSVSLDSQSSIDSLRIQFPCHRKRGGGGKV